MAFTFFFRDQTILNLIGTHVVPTFSGYSKIRIWDAGCAMGPEPYSLAITMAENMGRFAFRNAHIDATDIDEQGDFGKTIEEGMYPVDQLARVPPGIISKYFEPAQDGRHLRVVEPIRNAIHFRRHDLLSLNPPAEGYRLITCKNVLLHFHPDERVKVIGMFHSALAPGGFFATERTQEMPGPLEHLFERVSEEGHLYRKKDVRA